MSKGEVYDHLDIFHTFHQASSWNFCCNLVGNLWVPLLQVWETRVFFTGKVEFRFAGQGRQNQRLSQGQVYSGWFGKRIHFIHLNLDFQASQRTLSRKNEPRPTSPTTTKAKTMEIRITTGHKKRKEQKNKKRIKGTQCKERMMLWWCAAWPAPRQSSL